MKVKELLKVLSKDIKVAVSYTFNQGYEISENTPNFVYELDIRYVTANSNNYDLVIHVEPSDFSSGYSDFVREV